MFQVGLSCPSLSPIAPGEREGRFLDSISIPGGLEKTKKPREEGYPWAKRGSQGVPNPVLGSKHSEPQDQDSLCLALSSLGLTLVRIRATGISWDDAERSLCYLVPLRASPCPPI